MRDTKTKILDVAERLIPSLGAEKASLRRITEAAGVNIAAINYHFGCKNNLIAAVMVRILNPLIEKLESGLQDVMDAAGRNKPELEAILAAYLVPLVEFSRQHPDHEAMFAQFFNSYDDGDLFRQSIQDLVGKITRFYGECLVKALPELPPRTVLSRLAFFRNMALGIMQGNCMMDESMTILGLNMGREAMVDAMVAYAAAGFRARV
jgi:AcrR family transcriptional regulator